MTVRVRFDRQALRIVEAAYNLERATDPWMDTVLEAALPALDQGLGLFGIRYRITASNRVRFCGEPRAVGAAPPAYGRELREVSESLPAEFVRASWAHPQAFDTASNGFVRQFPQADFGAADVMASSRALGVHDNLVAKMVDANRNGLLLCAPMPAQRRAEDEHEARWRLVMAHLLAGLRLRQTLADDDDGEAVLQPDGRVLHARAETRSSAARDALRRAAVAIDRARSRTGTADPDAALGAWRGLVEGRWSLVDRFDSDGRRFLVARRNDPDVESPRALSRRERQIATYAALGHSNKRIAYTLGLSPATVSCHLQSAMRRLGVRDAAALADIFFDAPNKEEPS